MKQKIYVLLVLFCILIGSSAITHAQEPLSYVQWSPFPDIISAKTSSEIVLLSPELEEIDRWQIATGGTPILRYAWSHNGSRLAIMLIDGSVILWNVSTKQEIAYLVGSDTFLMEWSFVGNFLLLGQDNNSLNSKIWFVDGLSGTVSYV